ncbi:LPS-assembly protein LptD [Novosphingobium sp. TH158]|nr:LPS-assembly protein LptD [Novosphingobium sp. TH158]
MTQKHGLHRWLAGAASLALVLIGTPALSQDAATTSAQAQRPIEHAVNPKDEPAAVPFSGVAASDEPIGFEADRVDYAYDEEKVTASGEVVLRRDGQSVRADSVTWNRKTGEIVAAGNIRMVDKDGNQLFTDRVELTDELKAGAMENLLIALREGGRLAAQGGRRDANGNIVLTRASYTGCAVEDDEGCPKTPTWKVNAAEVTYDAARKNLRFRGARIELFGISLFPLPGLMLATDGRAISGLLIPDIRLSASNGIELSEGYYQRLANNRDVQVKGHIFTKAAPMISAQYRQLTDIGAFQVTGYLTRSSLIPVGTPGGSSKTVARGYLFGNGRLQFDPEWSLTSSIRVASDRTFLRRYDISRDDRLRSTIELERIAPESYLSVSGWATQTMRVGVRQGLVPVALPVIDYRRRISDVAGGKVELQLNSLAISRTSGQETQRAFAGAKWDLTRMTGMGQLITLTGLARGDIYHSSDNALTSTPSYRGSPGWQARALATAAVDVKWPLVGQFMNGTQVLTPRFQIVASPTIRNLAVPNEDARAIDLEDSNLFALNRFPGYDRIEDGVRFTYGVDWQWQAPGWRVKSTIGQSYRLTSKPTLFPDGTGLNKRASDIVGRTEVRFRDIVKLTHRFRLDKDDLAIRRNEFDATIGSQKTYFEVGYLRLNRDITSVEDLQDREELRFSARAKVGRHWSVFGSGVINMTNQNEDPLNTSDGWQPLRTRLGVAYEDDCLELALTWRRDFVATGDAVRGNTFQIYFALRNLGLR